MNRLQLTFALTLCLAMANASTAQELEWQSDIDLAKNLATKNGKLVLMHFTAEWCRPCKQLQTFVFPTPTVISAINERFVPVLVDTDENPELVKQYSVDSIPMDIVITPEGRLLQKRQSPKDATNFIRMISAVDHADTRNAQRNAMISTKIGNVLKEIESGAVSKRLSEHNDLAVKPPELVAEQPSKESQQLVAKSKTRLVEHVAEVHEGNPTAPDPTPSKPMRVINDRFFAAKSHPSQPQASQATIRTNEPVQQSSAFQPQDRISPATNQQAPTVSPKQVERQPMAIPKSGEFVPSATDLDRQFSNPNHSADERPQASVVKSGKQSSARLLKKVEQVPGKIEVNAVRENLSTNKSIDSSKLSVKIVPAKTPEVKPANKNLLRSNDLSIPDLIRSSEKTDLRDSVQKMFDSAPKVTVKQSPKQNSRIGLGGKCPVTLVEDGKWELGDKKFGCVHRGRTYLFGSARKLATFQASPEKYSPILAGFDPVIFHKNGELVEGLEKHGVFMGKAPSHRIVLFASQESRNEFQDNPKKYMATVRLAIKQSDNMR